VLPAEREQPTAGQPPAVCTGGITVELVNVPVRLFSAFGEHAMELCKTHSAEGGRIRMPGTERSLGGRGKQNQKLATWSGVSPRSF
jgi:non-homologous end joining protein Ku